MILWDSRCMHYGAAAKGDRPRVATCTLLLSFSSCIVCNTDFILDVCYKPAGAISPEFAELRKEVMKNHWSTVCHVTRFYPPV